MLRVTSHFHKQQKPWEAIFGLKFLSEKLKVKCNFRENDRLVRVCFSNERKVREKELS